MQIKNSAAIITGGVSGLGEVTARALVEAGSRVALLDLNQELGEELAADLGANAAFFAVNVTIWRKACLLN
jgi:NAD(P)-dependent dehydrogenase (short-subunit alcohol dehydrogenase family)